MDIIRCPFLLYHMHLEKERYCFTKSERLCSKKGFDALLASGKSFIAYPFRIVYNVHDKNEDDLEAKIAISIPKKRFKRAVKRNRLKRLTREAYRINKNDFYRQVPEGKCIDILFIYLSDSLSTFNKVEKSVNEVFRKITQRLEKPDGMATPSAN